MDSAFDKIMRAAVVIAGMAIGQIIVRALWPHLMVR